MSRTRRQALSLGNPYLLSLLLVALPGFAQGVFTVRVGAPGVPPEGTVDGALLSIVPGNRVELEGTNSLARSARVVVDGSEATFDPVGAIWSHTATLRAGFNRLLIQVFDANGIQLLATNRAIVAEMATTTLGGPLTTNTTLTSALGVLRVTNSVVLNAGALLAIEPGCVFLVSSGANFLVTNTTITVSGTEAEPVVFAPADGATPWGGVIGSGVGARLEGKNAELMAGHLQVLDGAQAVFENSYLHDYLLSSPPIIHTLGQPNDCSLALRRSHVQRYYEILCQLSTNLFEDCLMEYPAQGGDGIDFDGARPGSAVQRCTVRHGNFTNVDAVDTGEYAFGDPSQGVLIESCLLYDFVDKGISMGVQVDVTVTNCLIHQAGSGIAVKDLSTAGIYNCAIASNSIGFHCYNKADPSSPTGGGFITNSFNNILWGNGQAFSLANGSVLTASYSDFQDATVPGTGNVCLDPLWVEPALMDYRLSPGSPLLGAGRDGVALGPAFPVGAPMAASHPVLNEIQVLRTNVVVGFWADSERSYSLVASETLAGGSWTKVLDVFPAPRPRRVAITNEISPLKQRFFRLVTPRVP